MVSADAAVVASRRAWCVVVVGNHDRPSDRSPQGRNQREGTRAGAAGERRPMRREIARAGVLDQCVAIIVDAPTAAGNNPQKTGSHQC